VNCSSFTPSSEAFDELLKHYKRQNVLEIGDINDFTTNLLRKFNCNSFYRATDCTRVGGECVMGPSSSLFPSFSSVLAARCCK
jgi:hypothetical protein